MTNQDIFENLMGDCCDLKMSEITEDEVREQCEVWRLQHQTVSFEDEDVAVNWLLEYQGTL